MKGRRGASETKKLRTASKVEVNLRNSSQPTRFMPAEKLFLLRGTGFDRGFNMGLTCPVMKSVSTNRSAAWVCSL